MKQAQLIHNYAKQHSQKFNENIFKRSSDKIIYYLEQMILSCQRKIGVGGYFTLEVENFEVVENYKDCQDILAKYQDAAMSRSAKLRAAMDNRYSYIDLKPTDLELLIITYKIETYEGAERFETILAIPRIIDKFFVNINSNQRSLMFQMVESTYNNDTSSSKTVMVTLKSTFNAIRIYRHVDTKTTVNGEEVQLVTYDADLFKKSVPVVDYIFAKMGFIPTIQFLGLDGFIHLTTFDPKRDDFYTFCPRKTSGMFISVPKEFLKKNMVLQHIVNTLCLEFTKKAAVFPDILGRKAWIYLLGRHFNLATPYAKGISVLSSLNLIYDRITKETIYLPDVDKQDIFCIFRWMLYEYDALYLKNNLDLRMKRIRCEEYVAALYAPKLSKGIYALSDMGERVTLKDIKKRLSVEPLFIINELSKSSLSNFHDMVSDTDCFVATKESNQGVSGISDGTSQSLPDSYLYLNESHIGILGLSESSPSSVGSSSNLTPFTKFDNHGYFSTWGYREPDTYRERLMKDIEEYRKNTKEKEVAALREKLFIRDKSEVPELKIGNLKISEETLQKLMLINK